MRFWNDPLTGAVAHGQGRLLHNRVMRHDRRIRPGELAFCCWLTALALALPGLALATEQGVGVARGGHVVAAAAYPLACPCRR